MKMREIRGFNSTEVQQRLADLREELFNLRFQYATRQLTNHARIREVRRDIARIQTLLREQEWELPEMEA
jgi:large subunit ribosomal protein L29